MNQGSRYAKWAGVILAFIKPGLLPYLLALILAIFAMIYEVVGLPSPADIVQSLKDLILSGGFLTFAFIAFVEALFMLSIYFPGSLVIVLTVIYFDQSVIQLIQILALCILGFLCANVVNYYIGRFGFHKILQAAGAHETLNATVKWIRKRGRIAILAAGVHPNVMAACVVCLGVAGMPFHKAIFLSTASLIGWSAIYVPILALLSESKPSDPGKQIFFLIFLFTSWGLALSILKFRRKSINS